eukprot:s334_g27.t1
MRSGVKLSRSALMTLLGPTTPKSRDSFIAQMRQIDPDIPPTRLQSLIQVLAASHLLQEVDFNRVEALTLPNTSQRAMVVRLSHIPRFREKPAFLNQANNSYAMLHGTNLIGAKYCLAEGLVRPADWSYDENLSKCEQPTYGCFSGKGQQEILLALQYKGAKEHLALKAGGNDWAQLQCALKGVVTTSEKYTVARSEHCTIRSLIVVWQDLSFIEGGTLGSTPSPCPSQRGSTPPSRPPTPAVASPTQDEPRVYGFDANQFWQSDTTHHDCNKGNAAAPVPAFEPASLLVTPTTPNDWLKDHPITSLAVRTFKQWLHDLDLSPAQRSTVERNLTKVEDWWQAQPDSAIDTVQRTALMMGLPVSILKGNFNDTNLVKVLTVAVTMSC